MPLPIVIQRVPFTPMSTWYKKARARMKELGLTQEDLCPALGVKTRGAVGHYLNGRRDINTKKATSLAEKLHMSMSELYGEDEIADSSNSAVEDRYAGLYVAEKPTPRLTAAELRLLYEALVEARDDLMAIEDIEPDFEMLAKTAVSRFNSALSIGLSPSELSEHLGPNEANKKQTG